MKMRPLVIYGLLMIMLAAAAPVPPPPNEESLSHLAQPAPDPTSALPWLRPDGRF